MIAVLSGADISQTDDRDCGIGVGLTTRSEIHANGKPVRVFRTSPLYEITCFHVQHALSADVYRLDLMSTVGTVVVELMEVFELCSTGQA